MSLSRYYDFTDHCTTAIGNCPDNWAISHLFVSGEGIGVVGRGLGLAAALGFRVLRMGCCIFKPLFFAESDIVVTKFNLRTSN